MFIEQEMMVNRLTERVGELGEFESRFVRHLKRHYVGNKWGILTSKQDWRLKHLYDRIYPSSNGNTGVSAWKMVATLSNYRGSNLTPEEKSLIQHLRQNEKANLYFSCTPGQGNALVRMWKKVEAEIPTKTKSGIQSRSIQYEGATMPRKQRLSSAKQREMLIRLRQNLAALMAWERRFVNNLYEDIVLGRRKRLTVRQDATLKAIHTQVCCEGVLEVA